MNGEVSPMLAPVAALVIWTLILQLRMSWTRRGRIQRKGLALRGGVGGERGIQDAVLEDHVPSNAGNPDRLMEQPTLFYAIAILMALLHTHGESRTNFVLAWAYVFLRIAHSLVPAMRHAGRYKFLLFILASIALLGLSLHAAIHAF